MCMGILLRKKSTHINNFKAHKTLMTNNDDFSVCSLNTKLFYHGLRKKTKVRMNKPVYI